MSSGRAIDHIGLASRDLDGLAARYEALGFTLTPRAWHQDHMGTSNRLVQFGGPEGGRNFIELLEVDRPDTMLPHGPGFMGFGQFNHDFLRTREGMSLIIFRTDDTAADLARWREKGLDVCDQFNFERQATLPDGSQATVRFELGFVTSPAMPDILFYVCDNKAEEHFWKPPFQIHENGADEITAIVIAAKDPAPAAAFLSALFDGVTTECAGGLSVACGAHRIDILTPGALPDAASNTLPDGAAAGFELRAPHRTGITPGAEAGGAFIQWTDHNHTGEKP